MAIDGMKDTVEIGVDMRLTQDQLDFCESNPNGLTKEGIEEEIKNWKLSKNRYQKAMYEYMLKTCKRLASSGKTTDGKDVLSRNKGKITWVGK